MQYKLIYARVLWFQTTHITTMFLHPTVIICISLGTFSANNHPSRTLRAVEH